MELAINKISEMGRKWKKNPENIAALAEIKVSPNVVNEMFRRPLCWTEMIHKQFIDSSINY